MLLSNVYCSTFVAGSVQGYPCIIQSSQQPLSSYIHALPVSRWTNVGGCFAVLPMWVGVQCIIHLFINWIVHIKWVTCLKYLAQVLSTKWVLHKCLLFWCILSSVPGAFPAWEGGQRTQGSCSVGKAQGLGKELPLLSNDSFPESGCRCWEKEAHPL